MENTSKSNMQSARLLPFDPIVLVQDVLKRWLVVVLAALAVGIGTYIYTDATYAPVYRTTTTFVVTTRGSSTSVYSNLSSTSNLAGLFTELLNSSIMRKTILQETDISSFNGTIDTAVVPNTNLITMTVTDSDPRMAFLAAQAIIEHHESLTYQVIDDIGLEVLQYPAVPTSPTNQNFAFHQMKKAAVIAALAATALLAILSYLRDAVRSGTEAREKLDCSYLGEISHERKYKTVFALLRRKKTSILITNPVTSFRFVESIRKLRRRVEQHMDGGKRSVDAASHPLVDHLFAIGRYAGIDELLLAHIQNRNGPLQQLPAGLLVGNVVGEILPEPGDAAFKPFQVAGGQVVHILFSRCQGGKRTKDRCGQQRRQKTPVFHQEPLPAVTARP